MLMKGKEFKVVRVWYFTLSKGGTLVFFHAASCCNSSFLLFHAFAV